MRICDSRYFTVFVLCVKRNIAGCNLPCAAGFFAADVRAVDPEAAVRFQTTAYGIRFQPHIFGHGVDRYLSIHHAGFKGGVQLGLFVLADFVLIAPALGCAPGTQ